MECNKDEAIRAKDMAEKRMQNKDFIGARKMALKAQRLFPELENLSQILTVCEVHCSTEVKVMGEMDWYGVLQVEPTVDVSSIKKQYRKLALILHPDKNQFAGAEAAFKLIGQAQMTLLDRAKRQLFDIKRNATVIPSKQPSQQADNFRTNSTTVNFNGVQQQQASFSNAPQTFWTICPCCSLRHQFPRNTINLVVRCPHCLKHFEARDSSAKPVPAAVNPGQKSSGNPPTHIPSQTNNFNPQNRPGNVSSSSGIPENLNERRGGAANKSTDAKVGLKGTSPKDVQFTNVEQKKQPSNAGQKRGRKVVTDSSDSDSTSDEAIFSENQYDSTSAQRRSSRHKPNVIYMDDKSDGDDNVQPPGKKLRGDTADASKDGMAEKHKDHILREEKLPNGTAEKESASMKGKSGLKTGSGSASGLDNSVDEQFRFNYPDPEFYDFDNFRHPTQFTHDQIWAIYDNIDGMPRFYARIRKIESPGFRVRFTWLEHNPTNDDEIAWSDAELPVACGNYKLGKSELSEDLLMFSHCVTFWAKGKRKNSYDVYPREGEVWALFKHWNISWSADPDSKRLYEYEVVEVLSNFAEGTGITVIPLVKIKGFVSLFMRAEAASFVVPPSEVLKFSHNVPYYKLTGTERKGIPSGCLELDCASLPSNFNESVLSVSLDTVVGSANVTTDKEKFVSHTKAANGGRRELHPDAGKDVNAKMSHATSSHNLTTEKNVPGQVQDPEIHVNEKHDENNYNGNKDSEGLHEKDADEIDGGYRKPLSPDILEIPETEFHRFEEEKKIENFERGQIWALYSDIDKYPKYYGYVRNVDIKNCKVQVAWLESRSQGKEEKRWLKGNMPVSCGIFEISQDCMAFDAISTFSHHVAAERKGKGQFTILPKVHEIWAVYKNWTVGWSRSDLEDCDYDVVEIFEDSGSCMKVNILTKVDGYRAVFRVMRDEKAASTMIIPADEYIRFSHRIPSFMLTNERGGKLMGCWELDTASVPELLLF